MVYSAYVPDAPPKPLLKKNTSSPGRTRVTELPIVSTIPAPSQPRTEGNWPGKYILPFRTFASIGFTPAACNFTSTADGSANSGFGMSLSFSTSGPPGAVMSTAFMGSLFHGIVRFIYYYWLTPAVQKDGKGARPPYVKLEFLNLREKNVRQHPW